MKYLKTLLMAKFIPNSKDSIRFIIDPENNGHNDNLCDPFNLTNGDCNDELCDDSESNIQDLKNALTNFNVSDDSSSDNHIVSIWKYHKNQKFNTYECRKFATILITNMSYLPTELQKKVKKLAKTDITFSGKITIVLDTNYLYESSYDNHKKYSRNMYEENYMFMDDESSSILKKYLDSETPNETINDLTDILYSLCAIREAYIPEKFIEIIN